MDWNDYKLLLALSRKHTLSAAARELDVVRTTVARRLEAAEKALGARLFDRTPDGFVPTVAGASILEAAQKIEDATLAAEAVVMGQDAALQGELRISTLDFIYEELVEVFQTFSRRYPGILPIISSSTDQVSLRRREADVVLRLSDTPRGHLVGRKLCTMEFSVYAHRSLVDRIGKDAPLEDYPWLCDDVRGTAPWLEAWFQEYAPGAKIVVRLNSFALMRTAMMNGVGAHFYPSCAARKNPDLIPLTPEHPPITRALWLLTLPELRSNTRVRAFMDHFWEALKN